MVQTLTCPLSKERLHSISITKPPKLRKRSISDSNLLLDNKVFLNNIAEKRLRSFTAVSDHVGKLGRHSISEMDLHRVNIIYGKPDASMSNRNTRCIGIRDKEEGDGAESTEQIAESHFEVNVKWTQPDGKNCSGKYCRSIQQINENQVLGMENDEDEDEKFEIEGKHNGRNLHNEDRKWPRNEENKNRNNKIQPPTTLPEQRKRKTGFSSFSLTKFMTGKMRTRLRSYEPDDPRQLIIAIRNRDINRVRYILEQCPVDVNGFDSKGVTAVHEAALDGQCDVLELLLQYQAKVNQTDKDGLTSLDYAVFGGHFECAAYLIDNGAAASSVRDGMPAYYKTNDWI